MPINNGDHRRVSQEKIAADLNWLLNSPKLIPLPDSVLEANFSSPTSKLQILASGILERIPEKIRLGRYFELLCQALIEDSAHWKIVYQNQQIIDDKKTIGEFDLILLNQFENVYEHWEIAIKFYLKIGEYYLGTNIRDRLDLKTKKLLEKQIRLSEHPVASKWLQNEGIVIRKRRVLSRGGLFQKATKSNIKELAKSGKYFWLLESDFIEYFRQDKLRVWRVLDKLEWISSESQFQVPLYNTETLLSHLRDQSYGAVYLTGIKPGVDTVRFMLVAERWLERAYNSLPNKGRQ